MADLKGDAKARQNLLDFVRQLDKSSRSGPQGQTMRSIRGRIENALPAIERDAAHREKVRLVDTLARHIHTVKPGSAAHKALEAALLVLVDA